MHGGVGLALRARRLSAGDGPGHASELELGDHARGVVLPVRARAGARRDGLQGVQAGALKVGVVQVPEKGKANQALLRVIAKALGLPRARLELLSGAGSPSKRFLVIELSQHELRERVDAALAGLR